MRRGRSERAGDLKAGNITLPLEWMTLSIRLTLPTAAVGLGLVGDVTELFHLLRSSHELKTRFAAGACLLDRIEPDLELFKLHADIGILGIELAVLMHLASESPVPMSEEGTME